MLASCVVGYCWVVMIQLRITFLLFEHGIMSLGFRFSEVAYEASNEVVWLGC
jgi:hypothetical protein